MPFTALLNEYRTLSDAFCNDGSTVVGTENAVVAWRCGGEAEVLLRCCWNDIGVEYSLLQTVSGSRRD